MFVLSDINSVYSLFLVLIFPTIVFPLSALSTFLSSHAFRCFFLTGFLKPILKVFNLFISEFSPVIFIIIIDIFGFILLILVFIFCHTFFLFSVFF